MERSLYIAMKGGADRYHGTKHSLIVFFFFFGGGMVVISTEVSKFFTFRCIWKVLHVCL